MCSPKTNCTTSGLLGEVGITQSSQAWITRERRIIVATPLPMLVVVRRALVLLLNGSRSINMSTVKVTATIEIEFEVRQELAQPALARIPHDVAVRIEHGSIGSSMTDLVPGTAKVHLAGKAIDGKSVP